MPRQDGPSLKAEVLSTPKSRAVVASAARMGKIPQPGARKDVKVEQWQTTLWQWYDLIGEYRYAVNWVGNLLSKAKLIITKDGKPVDDPNDPAVKYLAALFGGAQGQREMLRQFGIHFTVAGEGYLIGETTAEGDEWLVAAATMARKTTNGAWTVDEQTFQDPLVIRMWRPHPVKPRESDSPSKAVSMILSEIHGLTEHVRAQIDSRLASAGILILPSEITFGNKPVTQSETVGEGEAAEVVDKAAQQSLDGFVELLITTMSTAIADRSDPSALVPIVLQVAGEFVDKIQHLTFWSELDKEAINLRKEAVRRLALGMDMPPEVLEGTGDMNHWSSWQMEEAAIKAHTEPLLAVLTKAITDGYIHSLLLDDGMPREEVAKYDVGSDTAEMRLRPNRSKEAQELYDRGALSLSAMLRENGFKIEDQPDPEELKQWFLRKVASGSTTPELVEAALQALSVPIEVTQVPVDEPADDTQEARPTPTLKKHPVRNPPEEAIDSSADAASVIVHRALERAGNRLRTKMGAKVAGVSAPDTYMHVEFDASAVDFLLEDSWGIVDRFAGMFPGADLVELKATLDSYTRSLLVERKAHSTEMLRQYLALMKAPH